MPLIGNLNQNRICCGIPFRRLSLRQYIASHWQIFHPDRCILCIIIPSLKGSRDIIILIIIFHNGVKSCCIRFHPSGSCHFLSILPCSCPEGKYSQILPNGRMALFHHRPSLCIQKGSVKGKSCFCITAEHLVPLSIQFPNLNGCKIVLHFKALNMACFLYFHIDRLRLYIALVIRTKRFLQHIKSNGNVVDPVRFIRRDGISL